MGLKPHRKRRLLPITIVIGVAMAGGQENVAKIALLERIEIPSVFQSSGPDGPYGGDIRVGDLDNDLRPDYIVYRCAKPEDGGDALKPCFIGAFNASGEPLWSVGSGGVQPARPGPINVYDLDGDGSDEIIAFFYPRATEYSSKSLRGIEIQVRDGRSGALLRSSRPEAIVRQSGSGANWVHQRLIVANLSGGSRATEFVVKLGDRIFALNSDLEVLWEYSSPWTEYQRCPAYIPSVGDIDGDGRDEVNGGYFLLDDDGSVLWERFLGPNMDSVAIAEWDNGQMRAICSGAGQVVDSDGNVILNLGVDVVPHGQELRLGYFDPNYPAPQMMIRYNGHKANVMLIDGNGSIVRRFALNDSPNHTGMETVYPYGPAHPALLFNGGILWNGQGEMVQSLPDLPPPQGHFRQGWYHCIPANLYGDSSEEMIVYNPWDRFVFVYGVHGEHGDQSPAFEPGPRQYNVRLLD